MKRLLLAVIFMLFLVFPQFLHAQTPVRYAECDLCGYCQGKVPPGNWESCRKCLYPSANPTPTINDTLQIDPETSAPIAPALGHHYTMIGCWTTNLGDFTNPSSAGSVVSSILDFLFKIAGGVAFIYLMYGSFIVITSQGDAEKLNYGRRVITGAVVGLIFSLSSILIINLLASGILRLPMFNGDLTPTPTP